MWKIKGKTNFYIKNQNDAMQKEYFYELLNIHPLTNHPTKTVFQIFLRPLNAKMPYQAGQYIEIQYPDGSFQPFSIANAPHPDGLLELLIRSPEKNSPHPFFLEHLRTVKKARLIGPFGLCTAKPLAQKPCLLLSGGVGFSQSKAVIEQLVREKHAQPIHLYWGIQNPQSLFLEDLLFKWRNEMPQFKYTRVFSEPQPALKENQKNGYVHEAVLQDYPLLENYRVLASGPREMVFAAKNLFQQGLPEKNLYSDWFNLL